MIHVRIEIYIVVVGCISFRREVSVNELHTHTHTVVSLRTFLTARSHKIAILQKQTAFIGGRNGTLASDATEIMISL